MLMTLEPGDVVATGEVRSPQLGVLETTLA
jgi:hypothetical protein